MIEVIRGSNEKPVSTKQLVDYFLPRTDVSGILYIGYPIVNTPIGSISLDAMLVSKEHGVLVFDIEEGTDINDRTEKRDEIYNNIRAKLLQNKELVEKRELKVQISVCTFAPAARNEHDYEDIIITDNNLAAFVDGTASVLTDDTYRNLVSVIQTVTSIRRASKRIEVLKENSRGAKLKKLEASIANLDRHQSAAVIETAEGLQRIRGLAGSGKTIILALKVAYLHSTHPDWDIAVTFNARTLKDQFIDLITKFTIEHRSEDPDWKKIKILHAWGSPSMPGVYYDTCVKYGIEYSDFGSAKNKYITSKDAFGNVCNRALEDLNKIENFDGIYDALLIDEAQDFSGAFLKLCYKILKEPKRLIWAYDELQKLNEITMQSTEELFGVTLSNDANKPKQDIILEKCYRNSRPLLVTAQALGFGMYREKGLVQMFDRPLLWNEIGYQVAEGELRLGSKVTLKRTDETSPLFLETHSEIDDLVTFKNFENNQSQVDWVASEIEKNLKEEELQYGDIIVINCDPLTTSKVVGPIREKLFSKGINSHLAGVTHTPDKFFGADSITFTGIYRAKGNEAPMVYIINSQYSFDGYELIKKRNILFTAITRSKAWVRICGYGEQMGKLSEEYNKIKDRDFQLEFTYPTPKEMNELNIINREMTRDEKDAINHGNKTIKELMRNIKEGKMRKEDIEPDTLEELKELIDAETKPPK